MTPYHHILVPIDFSNGSRRAMEKAQELCKLYNAKLTVLSVIEPLPPVAYTYIGSADIEDELQKHAAEQLSEWGNQYAIPNENQLVVTGHPKVEIAKVAKDLNCDLIIIGSHGHHGLLSHLLGSTSTAVTHHATCDILIVRKAHE